MNETNQNPINPTLLRERGIAPSYQRLRILEYLQVHNDHPSVDTIHRALNPEIPTLSKTTVYNTLKLFVDRGVVATLGICDHEMRYDAEQKPHAHFRCSRCGRVYDVMQLPVEVPESVLEGHEIEAVQVHLTGICRECKKNAGDVS